MRREAQMSVDVCCRICSRPLTKDEHGLNNKILERDAKNGFWRCLTCMAEYLECEEEELKEKIEEFKIQGCKLFS